MLQMIEDFGILTDAQRKRDEAVIEDVYSRFIEPLVDDLEKTIPGYSTLDEMNRFRAIMEVNEKTAPAGEYLPLDFGLFRLEPCDESDLYPLRGAAFSGKPMMSFPIHGTHVKRYLPTFAERINLDWGEGDLGLNSSYEILADYPLPYRIAAVAHHIRRYVICSLESACRFAAGWEDRLEVKRLYVEMLAAGEYPDDVGTLYACHGWTITIRDTKPGNDIMLATARFIRETIADDRSRRGNLPSYFTEQNPGQGQTRSKHQSTEKLEDFLFRFLPSKGMHIGRKGKGNSISWSKAHMLFMEEYDSETYSTMESFQSRCYALLKANRRKVD